MAKDIKKLQIKLVKSVIGCPKDQVATVKAIGLKKTNSTVVQENTAPIQGMIFKIKHLVEVTEV